MYDCMSFTIVIAKVNKHYFSEIFRFYLSFSMNSVDIVSYITHQHNVNYVILLVLLSEHAINIKL